MSSPRLLTEPDQSKEPLPTETEEKHDSVRNFKPTDLTELTAKEREPSADQLMWLNFESKIRAMTMNMIEPVLETMVA